MEYQSSGSGASFPLSACADWDDEIKWEIAAGAATWPQSTSGSMLMCKGQDIWASSHTSLSEHNTFQRPTVCREHRFVFPSGKKAYINICLVTGTHWPQDLKLLLWKLLKLLSFDITGFQPVLTDFQTVPFCGAYAPAVDLCLDKTLVSSSTSCRQGSGQTQGFAFSIRLPQRFRAC